MLYQLSYTRPFSKDEGGSRKDETYFRLAHPSSFLLHPYLLVQGVGFEPT